MIFTLYQSHISPLYRYFYSSMTHSLGTLYNKEPRGLHPQTSSREFNLYESKRMNKKILFVPSVTLITLSIFVSVFTCQWRAEGQTTQSWCFKQNQTPQNSSSINQKSLLFSYLVSSASWSCFYSFISRSFCPSSVTSSGFLAMTHRASSLRLNTHLGLV